jgi:hypothetical protein
MSSIVGNVISNLLTYAYLGKNKKDGYLLSFVICTASVYIKASSASSTTEESLSKELFSARLITTLLLIVMPFGMG